MPSQECQKSSSPRIRDNTFEGEKCSTHFPRLTRLGQWIPRVINPDDEGAFITRINGHCEDGSSLVQRISLINNPRHTCLDISDSRQHCLGIRIRYISSGELKTIQTRLRQARSQARQGGQNPQSARLAQSRWRQTNTAILLKCN